MKKAFLSAACILLGVMAYGQTTLPAPQKNLKSLSVMEALSTRHSERAFSNKELTDQELSNLLWAACGVNRPDGHITSPTAMNKQASLSASVPGSTLFVEKTCDTFEEAVDLCVDSMKVQLTKFKEKQRSR